MEIKDTITIHNRGYGAGGSNTNINGLSFEEETDISNYFRYENYNVDNVMYKIFYFNGNKIVQVRKKNLEKYLKNDFVKLEKSLQPDEAFIDIQNKNLYILEKKFQKVAGSVDEKIQTGVFKKEFYEELYPSYKIYYAYVLNDWFKNDKYKPELRYLEKYNISIFWSYDDNFYENIKNWIIS